MLGLGGGAGGSGFAGPQGVSIQAPTTDEQAKAAYEANQAALKQQQDFVAAVQAQNGLQNQSNVYNQLSNIASGQGPNPAQAMLNQATGQNVANQAALMAGQRGANANVGLMARQASQQGSKIQQDAAGQAAVMQAQQSLNALNNMGNLATNQANMQANATQGLTSAQQAEQANLLNAISAQNNSRIGMQSNINNANAAMAGGRMGQQPGAIGGLMNMLGPAGKMLGGGGAGGIIGGSDAAGMAGGGEGAAGGAFSGGMTAVPMMAEGGSPEIKEASTQLEAPKYQSFGQFVNAQSAPNIGSIAAPAATAGGGNFMGSAGEGGGSASGEGSKDDPNFNWGGAGKGALSGAGTGAAIGSVFPGIGTAIGAGIGAIGGGLIGGFAAAEGGEVPSLVSPGEQYLSPRDVQKVKAGANPMKVGEKIPGKAKVAGAKNSYSNDTVPKTLQEGGIVLPRSVTQSKNPDWAAHKFVREVLRKKKSKR